MPSTAAHFPHDHRSGMDTKAHSELYALLSLQTRIQTCCDGLDNPQTGMCGALRIILMSDRPAKVNE